MNSVLRVPKQSEEAEFLRADRATSPSVRHFLRHNQGVSFRRSLEVLAEQERGENLPANRVPSIVLVAVAGMAARLCHRSSGDCFRLHARSSA
jgi:hypothetical protein